MVNSLANAKLGLNQNNERPGFTGLKVEAKLLD